MIREVGVVIPARNEQQRIGRCLRALARSRALLRELRPEITIRTIVVLDRCTDATGAVVAANRVPIVHVAGGSVGVARAAGSAHLLAGARSRASQLWLASTDADSTVPPDWLAGMVEFAERGSDLVIGTALPMPGLAPALERDWLAAHALRDGHPHVHGANLGIRADAYRAAGGWPHLPTGEDERLVEHALAAGVVPTRTSAHPVRTSTRFTGRAPRGFSSYLRGLAAHARQRASAVEEG